MTKQELLNRVEESYATKGYGPSVGWKDGYEQCKDLDGKHARQFLEVLGFEVVANGDKGNRGFALTACGLDLSTNGVITRPAKTRI